MSSWPYMAQPESDAVLAAYSSECGLGAVDARRAHLAVMLWRDIGYLQSFLERSPRRPDREHRFRARIAQIIGLAEHGA